MNPWPCGYFGSDQKSCTCAPAVVTKYQKRISGPSLDHIDIHIEVPRVDYEKLSGDRIGESSASIRARAQDARDIQLKRFSKNGSSDIVCNADMRIGEIRQFCKLPEDAQSLMRAAMSQRNLSTRAYDSILKLARAIADLVGCEEIQSVPLAEALHAPQSPEIDVRVRIQPSWRAYAAKQSPLLQAFPNQEETAMPSEEHWRLAMTFGGWRLLRTSLGVWVFGE